MAKRNFFGHLGVVAMPKTFYSFQKGCVVTSFRKSRVHQDVALLSNLFSKFEVYWMKSRGGVGSNTRSGNYLN